MKRIALALCAALALVVGVSVANAGNSDAAKACQNGGWQNFTRTDGSGFKNDGDCVSYAARGGVLVAKVKGPKPVSEPVFSYSFATCSVTVPYTPGLDTRLYGVNGYSQDVPITHDVTISAGLDGLAGTAPQFWIGYTVQPGYVDSNPGAGTWHIDFYNGDLVADCAAA